jgi:maltooligosyltrehalose trehalohydrolase
MKVELQTPPVMSGKKETVISNAEEILRQRRLPVGAEALPGGGTHFRVWAPKSSFVKVQLLEFGQEKPSREVELAPQANGYFSGYIREALPGMLYRLEVKTGSFPDPVSRFQPEGPHGASQIVDSSLFKWTDQRWPGLKRSGQVIYEMHVGTFTASGTWAAAQEQLDELAKLGITVIEVMPVAEFPGRFGWGYDGVDLFAPTRLYGEPDDFRNFVDRAHAVGVGVILDVVYNHFGPDGNFLKHFSEDYFTDRHQNEWGEAINFDGEGCGPVREFFCANAAYWVQEFHLDGLRLDATQQIFDGSDENIMSALSRTVRESADKKGTLIVAENERQDARLVRQASEKGYNLDGLWNDDFHHTAMVRLTGRAEAYYSDYHGSPQELISAVKRGFLYQGQRSRWQKNPRGTPSFDLAPEQFVNFLQNHDQVANSISGLRAHQLASPGCLRAMTALLLLGPGTPMLFQGQEFAASAPFLYFADHHPELSKLVAEGRRSFLSQFKGLAHEAEAEHLAQPDDLKTFLRCKLDLSEREKNTQVYELHRDLLRLRREDAVFSQPSSHGLDGAVLSPDAFLLRFFARNSGDRLIFINLGADLILAPLAEPLVANPADSDWELIWSSESPRYMGAGAPPAQTEQGWLIPGQAALVFAARFSKGQSATNPKH